MRKSILMGTKEDVQRLYNSNKSKGCTFDKAMRALGTSVNKSTHPSQGRIVTFNHTCIK